MLVILPFILLLAVSLFILLYGRFRHRLGTIWMISASVVLLTWAGVLVLRLVQPGAFVIANWLPDPESQDAIRFELTSNSWFLAVAWMALLVAVIFTDAAALEGGYSHLTIAGSLAVSAVTLLSLMSTSLLSFLITWSMLDLIEFIVLAQMITDTDMLRKTVVSFAFRIIGTFLVIAALAISKLSGPEFLISAAQGNVYLLLLIGIGLRLGVQPLRLPFTQSDLERRTLGTILRMASPISALALLVQLPAAQTSGGILLLGFVLASLGALYGAAMWATTPTDLAGRQYWTLSLSGVAMLSAISGQTSAVIACAGYMIIAGSFTFVQGSRARANTVYFILLMITLVGLPYTPFSGLWGFEGGAAWSFTRLVQILTIALLTFGTLRHYFKKAVEERKRQNWISFFGSAGLAILVITPWLTLIWSRNLLALNPGWWYSLTLIVLTAAGFVFRTYFVAGLNKSNRGIQFMRDIAVFSARSLRNLFRFNWLFSIFDWTYRQLQMLIQFFEGVLEGEGGILWALVFLALLASVLASAGM